MNGKLKTAAYFAAGICLCLFGYLYSRQHSLVQRTAGQASTPLMAAYLCVFGVSLAVFVLLGAFDLKKFFSNRIEQWMVQGSAPTGPVAELEEAQRVRAAG